MAVWRGRGSVRPVVAFFVQRIDSVTEQRPNFERRIGAERGDPFAGLLRVQQRLIDLLPEPRAVATINLSIGGRAVRQRPKSLSA